jgi:nicotinate-nucleotide pyrophosphorylase
MPNIKWTNLGITTKTRATVDRAVRVMAKKLNTRKVSPDQVVATAVALWLAQNPPTDAPAEIGAGK